MNAAPTWEEVLSRTAAPNRRTWICPEHQLEYGDGAPDPMGVAWDCPDCKRIAFAAERKFHAEHHAYNWWRRSSGVPHRYRAAVTSSIQPISPGAKALRTAVTAYSANLTEQAERGQGMVLLGPPGTGKTLALTAIINVACSYRAGPIYASWPDVIADVKTGFNGPKDDPRRTLIDRLSEAPLLALDELALKGSSDFEHAELFRLIDRRYSEGLPTLAATNATRDSFPGMVGERVADRLFETGPVLVMAGESQRGKVACTGPDAVECPPPSIQLRVHGQGAWSTRRIDARRSGNEY